MLMGRRGRKRRLAVEDEYWALILAGVGTVAACKQVGITRKTGYRWRAERGGLPPLRLAEAERGSRYLSLLERQRIATLRGQGLSVREIARRLGRSASTVSRELHRNMRPHDGGVYDGDLAHARAREVARRTRPSRMASDAELRQLVQEKLELEWSPEQIAGWLRLTHPDRPDWQLCHETIYQALYRGRRGGLSRELTKRLRTGRPLRKRRRRADERSPRFVTPAQLIDARPEQAHLRARVGDWEGDLIVGASSRSAIGTVVDRRSRYVKLVHLPDDHGAGEPEPVDDHGDAPASGGCPPDADVGPGLGDGSPRPSRRPVRPRACTSPIPASRGSAAPTRTPTGCFASTSRSAPTCRATPPRISPPWRNDSTTGPARPSAGAPRPTSSPPR